MLQYKKYITLILFLIIMKIVHVIASDSGGGAAIAAKRHCEAMIGMGIEARLLTLTKVSHSEYLIKYHLGVRAFLPLLYQVLHEWVKSILKPTGTFSIMKFGFPLYKDKVITESDVIFIHWVNNAISISGVEKILKLNKKTFWYMHDMFPITGGCHHSLGCKGYTGNCSDCPLINGKGRSLASRQLKSKIKHWKKYSNLSFVTPSKWLADCVKESTLAQGHEVKVVPNTIDTGLFKPLPFDCKTIFGLDTNKKTILFSADLSGSIYKGSQYTIDCLKLLDPDKYEGLIIGNMPKGLQEEVPIKVIATGYLMDQLSLVLAYNACDTVLISSIAENYPNVILEAMACGIPCVGFNTGGIPDLIHHKTSGYISFDKTSVDLFNGIDYIISDETRYSKLSYNARYQVVAGNDFSTWKEKLNTLFA